MEAPPAVTLFLDNALAIGRRLVEKASWSGKQCTWEVRRPRPDPKQRTETCPADGTIYHGTAGIAFFLGELHRATGEPEVGRTAREAMAPLFRRRGVELARPAAQGDR